jgi:type IV pilus assembly protein PilY1
MKKLPLRLAALVTLVFMLGSGSTRAQNYSEDFTGITTNNPWYFSGGACLTAGTSTSTAVQPGPVVGCATALSTYYSLTPDKDARLVGGDNGTLPDAAGSGALRFTNGSPYGHFQAGSIVSGFPPFPTSQGVQISFKTITYLGNSGGSGKDGADGISFFLMDGCVPLAGATLPAGCANSGTRYGTTPYVPLGAVGGSLGYSCSNATANGTEDGLTGGYLGLGIDEFGNFLNGVTNTLNETGSTDTGGDNTATGGLYQPGRIGLRGAGSINWQALNAAYGTDPANSGKPYYPSSLYGLCPSGTFNSTLKTCGTCSRGSYNATSDTCVNGQNNNNGTTPDHGPPYSQLAVQNTCKTAKLYNYSNKDNPQAAGNTDLNNANNTAKILDYTAIAGGFSVLSANNPIANEAATTRSQSAAVDNRAKPIVYNLNITQDGLLTFAYSYNGGAFQNVLTNTDIKRTNGNLPSSFRFGFAGSTGGSTNVHEILCFKATPNEASASSGGLNTFENPQIVLGTQIFLASYFPTKAWAGALTAQSVGFDTTLNAVAIKSVPNWDASCVLTGVTGTNTCSTGQTNMAAQAPTSRIMLTWNGTSGIPFEWSNLTNGQKSALDPEDLSAGTANRLNFLRGDRSNEIPAGQGLFRARSSVLGDIIDSSPTWVGPPATYPTNLPWVDALHPTTQQPEGTGQTYDTFRSSLQSRLNVVYIGANDGFLHGFRTGSFDGNNNFVDSTTTPNDGHEVLAYMPGAVVQTIHSNTAALDYSNTQYAHAYFVDATPGSGDVFYGGAWHTWLVGGFGAGGPGIYALDVTDPSQFAETKPGTVIGEWTPAGIPGGCMNQSNCGDSMGNISGVPQIRRFHNGKWGVLFGNGLSSASGDAGIFIMLLDKSTGKPSFLYLSATRASKASPGTNGIVAVSAADLDSDHITDYAYAGDLHGNVWRFDLTNTDEGRWGVSASSPLFTEPSGLPITTQVTVSTLRTIVTQLGLGSQTITHEPERIILNFGTGRVTPQSVTAATQYATGPHYLYGVWDSDMTDWNTQSPNQPAVALPVAQVAKITSRANLLQQTITTTAGTNTTLASRSISHGTVCWTGSSACTPGQMGWYVQLPGTNEQTIFDPVISPDGELVVNTFIPSVDTPLSCSSGLPTGFTMGMEPDTGAGSPTPFFFVNGNLNADGVQLNGTGIPSFVMSGQSSDGNAEYLLTQSTSGNAAKPTRVNRHAIVTGQRLNWIQRR